MIWLISRIAVTLVFVGAAAALRPRSGHAASHPETIAAAIEQGGPGSANQPRPPNQAHAAPNLVPDPHPNAIAQHSKARAWSMPKLDGVDNLDAEIVDLAVSEDGTRVLAKSKKQVVCFDLSTGQVLQTFRPGSIGRYSDPRTEHLFMSPNAKLVASRGSFPGPGSRPGDALMFMEAETGEVIWMTRLERDFEPVWDAASFTPRGESLIVPGKLRGQMCLQMISPADGSSKYVDLPIPKNENPGIRTITPIPGRAAFLAFWSFNRLREKRPTRLSVLDVERGTDQVIESIDVEPHYSYFDRRVALSPDGGFVLVADIQPFDSGDFELADLRTDHILMKHPENYVGYSCPRFTPDGKRFVIEWGSRFVKMYVNRAPNLPQRETVPSTLRLYGVSDQKLLGEFTPEAWAQSLAISGDGRTIVYSHGPHFYAADFKTAFRVEPLPPLIAK